MLRLTVILKVLLTGTIFHQIGSAASSQSQKKTVTPRPARSTVPVDLPQAIQRVRPAIVKVVFEGWNAQGNKASSSGTGFFISDEGTVITAAHVLALPPGFTTRTHLSVRWPLPPTVYGNVSISRSFAGIEAHIAGTDLVHDLAALTLLKSPVTSHLYPRGDAFDSPLKTCALLQTTMISDGSEVFTSGFPGFSSNTESVALFTTSGHVASSQPTEFEDNGKTLKDIYFLDMRVNHGNSGGPAFALAGGSVVGVIDVTILRPPRYRGKPRIMLSKTPA